MLCWRVRPGAPRTNNQFIKLFHFGTYEWEKIS
jgi:hypothetical protein